LSLGAIAVILFYFVVFPTSGLVAAAIGWWSLKKTAASWPGVWMATGVLLLPYLVVAIVWPGEGLDMAFSPNPLVLISPVVAVAIALGAMLKFSQKRS
jgi:hypothetical protein